MFRDVAVPDVSVCVEQRHVDLFLLVKFQKHQVAGQKSTDQEKGVHNYGAIQQNHVGCRRVNLFLIQKYYLNLLKILDQTNLLNSLRVEKRPAQ